MSKILNFHDGSFRNKSATPPTGKDFWLREFQAMRYKNLVYLATMKCACTHYIKFFHDHGWESFSADNIEWDQDHVFSFMLSPDERRLKGLTEFVWVNNRQELLNQDSLFWGGVLYLDMHSVPYTLSYGKYCEEIDWIPLDLFGQPPDTSEKMLVSLLKKYNLEYQLPTERYHSSNTEKLEIYNIIKEKTGNGNFAMHLGLEDDINLYHRVCVGVRPWLAESSSWDQVSWLNNHE